jgi:hypothetical protein
MGTGSSQRVQRPRRGLDQPPLPLPSRTEVKKRRAIHLLQLWPEVRIPAEARSFKLFQNVEIGPGALLNGSLELFSTLTRRDVQLTTNFQLMPRIRTSGSIPPHIPQTMLFQAVACHLVLRSSHNSRYKSRI